ncbi:MAG: anti-sigma factor antagonist [Maritimibacter sp.]|nr:anti-sigma factor antagonist [Maritimibacter sp.]
MTRPSPGAVSSDLASPEQAFPGLESPGLEAPDPGSADLVFSAPDGVELATLELPARLDLKSAEPLKNEILAQRGHGLALDAGKVEHLGAIGLQLIRSAARSWAEDGHVLAFVGASNDLADQMVLLGFTPETITRWEPA